LRRDFASGEAPSSSVVSAETWSRRLAPFKSSEPARALRELILTVGPLLGLWVAAWTAAAHGLWWLALLATVPAAFFLVRVFLVQHDCGHGAFFRNASTNDWVGRACGVLTLTPYECWRGSHALHHASSGDLDRRGNGEGAIDTLTVAEYRALTPMKRFGYRLYRHPVVLFGVGPSFLYFLQQRLPVGMMRQGWRPWIDALGNTAAVLVVFGGLAWLLGIGPVLLVNAVTVVLAATIGVWLFYVQHQFENAVWVRSAEWKARGAAFHGSSFYDLPGPLPWLTAYVGVHHVHHLSSRIPFYRLPEVLRAYPELRGISRVGFRESFRCARLALWDEERHRLVRFRDVEPV
jgi:omega-6 fatty acid desaturase (delta-12 desaturase)